MNIKGFIGTKKDKLDLLKYKIIKFRSETIINSSLTYNTKKFIFVLLSNKAEYLITDINKSVRELNKEFKGLSLGVALK